MKITKLKMLKIGETLKDFKCLLPRFDEVKNDRVLLREFCMRNRNPIWDLKGRILTDLYRGFDISQALH